jgi:hypothetical protein
MARVPVVESPCPVAGRPLPDGTSDHCGICDRAVHNLDRISAAERRVFMAACTGQVCVAYTVRLPASGLRPRLAAASIVAAATIASLPAAAQDSLVVGSSPAGDVNGLPHCDERFIDVVVTGGVNNGGEAQWADDGKDAPPELPTMDDDGR